MYGRRRVCLYVESWENDFKGKVIIMGKVGKIERISTGGDGFKEKLVSIISSGISCFPIS